MHTSEPWGVETTDTTLWVGPMRHGGKVEDVVTAIDCNVHHYKREYLDKQRANARRIVACVNALSGISTEAIEAGAVQGLVDAAEKLSNAERGYRLCHDVKGDGHIETGRAWDYMRKCGNELRAALSQLAEASNA